MKTFLKFLPTLIDRFIWTVGLFAITFYTTDRWPTAYWVTMCALLSGFGVWYVWKFVILPFRAGLKGE